MCSTFHLVTYLIIAYLLSAPKLLLTFSFVNDGKCIVGNIGDSCCFMLRKNELKKITKDHSLVQAFVDSGSLTEEEAKNHPNKNIITRRG